MYVNVGVPSVGFAQTTVVGHQLATWKWPFVVQSLEMFPNDLAASSISHQLYLNARL